MEKAGKLFRNVPEKSGVSTREYGEKPIAEGTPRRLPLTTYLNRKKEAKNLELFLKIWIF
jgi:hypothetical protein